jgi:RNA polymerase sigma factor (sigma-70 family)
MKKLVEVVQEAGKSRVAIGHLNVADLVLLKGVFQAAHELNVPWRMGGKTGSCGDAAARQFREEPARSIRLSRVHSPSRTLWQLNCDQRCMQKMPEAELIAISKQGHQDAIAELFRRHYPSSLRLATGVLRRPDDAQDAVQAAYFLAFRRLGHFRGDASFGTWISRIVLNCCLLQLRDARRRVILVDLKDRNGAQGPDLLASRTPNPERSAWGAEMALALSKAVARLPKHLVRCTSCSRFPNYLFGKSQRLLG